MGHIRIDKVAFKKLVGEKARDTLVAAAAYVESEAKIICPVRTGRLKNSLHAILPDSNDQGFGYVDNAGHAFDGALGLTAGPLQAFVGTNVEYSIYVEMGTSKMSARPYLRPALESLRSKGWRVESG